MSLVDLYQKFGTSMEVDEVVEKSAWDTSASSVLSRFKYTAAHLQ